MILSFVTDRIATGGKVKSSDDVCRLLAAGVTHVLDLQEVEGEARWFEDRLDALAGVRKSVRRGVTTISLEAERSGGRIAYCWNPTADDGQPKPASWFGASWDFVRPALLESRSNKVYCHCRQGYNRGPSTAYFLLRAYGATWWQAHLAIYWHRPITIFGGARYIPDAERALTELGLG